MTQLVAYGGEGKSHWGQVQCEKCTAWLREMPDRDKEIICKHEDQYQEYLYYWTCLSCGRVRKVSSSTSPEDYTANPEAELHEPGTLPPPVVENPEKWDTAKLLSPGKKKLICYCWEMIESLRNALTIHKIIYIWNIHGALEKQNIEEVMHSAQEYVDLLDHEAIHGKESGSYHGAEGDVTKIRSALSKIEKEKDVK
jgi:hypothetical protein